MFDYLWKSAATVSRVASEVRNTRAHAAAQVFALPTESIVLSSCFMR